MLPEGLIGDAQMNDLLRDYKRWNYVERVAVAVVVAIAAVVVAAGLFWITSRPAVPLGAVRCHCGGPTTSAS